MERVTETDATATQIAIVGMACRFPGAKNVEEFWANLCGGVESIRRLTDEEMLAAGLDPDALEDPHHVPFGALIDGVDRFDAAFFGITAREAEIMDPQQRLFLEGAWEALEHAGYAPTQIDGAVAIFGGANFNSYVGRNLTPAGVFDDSSSLLQAILSNDKDYLATRVAYKLNLRGPAYTVQSGCSTSLLAVHLAMHSLLNYECDVALAGGVAIDLTRLEGYWAHEGSVAAPDGHCRAFDAKARGTVFGNGMGIVVLKRLEDAMRDGDEVYAVILGSAVNNDGAVKVGFTAPSVAGQVAAITEALADAGVPSHSIGYVEAHGTGTLLGDPVEVEALTRAFGPRPPVYGRCAIGSVKTNIGHLDSAAGVASLIKAALALRTGLLPASLNFSTPNPAIDFDRSPFVVNTALTSWTSGTTPALPRRAGVSSFGMGGTNVHLVLQEPPPVSPSSAVRDCEVLVWSARTREALDQATANLAQHLKAHPRASLADVAFTLQDGRPQFAHRRTLACRNVHDAIAALEDPSASRIRTGEARDDGRRVAFMFPGQGSQHINMARGLYESEPVFREELNACSADLSTVAGLDLLPVLYPDAEGAAASARERLQDTEWTQPALFAIEYALARLWYSWGITPAACIGHSLGEYVAACLAGVFSRRDALRILVRRGQLMQQLPEGAMTAVAQSVEAVSLAPGLSIAAVNGPALCVVSGALAAIAPFEERLRAQNIEFRRLRTTRAFHSPMVDAVMRPFAEEFASIRLSPPSVPFISNVTGQWIKPEETTNPYYWAEQLRRPVRFADGLACLLGTQPVHLLEVGPGRTLTTLAKQQRTDPTAIIVNTLPAPSEEADDRHAILDAAGRLWQAGVTLDWPAVRAHQRRRRVALPTYPFQRSRFWVDPPDENAAEISKRADPAEWLYAPAWRQTVPVALLDREVIDPHDVNWLVFADDSPLATEIGERLQQLAPGRTALVRAGARTEQVGPTEYVLDPTGIDGYRRVVGDLVESGWTAATVVHLWSLTNGGFDRVDLSSIKRAQDFGFYSLLRIAQACDAAGLSGALSIRIVTRQAHDVLGGEPLAVASASVFSPARVLAQERPMVECSCIDVDTISRGAADRLMAELLRSRAEPSVAFRGSARFVPTYERIVPPAARHEPPVIRRGGTFVILGGLGKIGLALGEHLARTAQARIVLIGRTTLPPREAWGDVLDNGASALAERIRRVQRIEAVGGEVLALAADIGKAHELDRAFEQAERQFGPVRGVIAAAGIVDREAFQMASAITPSECERQFYPKLDGLTALQHVLASRDVDFCMVVSSVSSVLGGLGYSAYAAANLLMDAYVRHHNRNARTRWLTTNWDAWRWTELPPDAARHSAAACALTATEAGVVFDHVLRVARDSDQVVISTTDLQRRIRDWVETVGARAAAKPPSREPVPVEVRKETPAVAPALERQLSATQRAVIDVWKHVLGIREVALNETFLDLGGTSLTAVQAISRMQHELGVHVAIEEFIFQTAAQLAVLCDRKKAEPTPPVAARRTGLFASLRGTSKGR